MQISAVICTHLRNQCLGEAIDSVLSQPSDALTELIVVDNSPDPGALSDLIADYADEKRIRFLHTTVIGLSNARNTGAAAATGRIVAYLDDDAIASPTWAKSILDVFDEYGDQVGIVGGPVAPIWIEPPPKWLTKRFHEIFSLVDRGGGIRILEDYEWVAGCNIAFDRKALLAADGFDPALGRRGEALLSNEETVACDRLRQMGKKMIFAPGALVHHVIPPGRTTIDWVVRRIAWQAISDAVAHPQRSIAHARETSQQWGVFARALRALRFFTLSNRYKRSLSERDYMFIYDVVNQLLCGHSL